MPYDTVAPMNRSFTGWFRHLSIGQKLLLVDGEEFPILEIRDLTINSSAPTVAD